MEIYGFYAYTLRQETRKIAKREGTKKECENKNNFHVMHCANTQCKERSKTGKPEEYKRQTEGETGGEKEIEKRGKSLVFATQRGPR